MNKDTMNEKDNSNSTRIDPDKDWLLQAFVRMANDMSAGGYIAITILSHGLLVSGHLVSGREYFEGVGKELASGFVGLDQEAVSGIESTFAAAGKKVYDKIDDDDNSLPPAFIHIKNAKFYHTSGNPIPGNRGVWWRGRLSEISGFSLGNLVAE